MVDYQTYGHKVDQVKLHTSTGDLPTSDISHIDVLYISQFVYVVKSSISE